MSMNLIFVSKTEKRLVDFPYETSTKITKSVLNADTKEEQLAILKEDIANRFEDSEVISDITNEMIEMINDNTLDLSEI